MIAFSLPALGQPRDSYILVIYSSSRLLPAIVEGDRALREASRTAANRPVAVFDEFLDASRFRGSAFESSVTAYLRAKYEDRAPDVIVAAGLEALDFVLRHRAEIFPAIPIVYVAVPKAYLESLPALPADVVGIPLQYEETRTIEQALRSHPRARRLVIVTGKSKWDREWEGRLRMLSGQFEGRVAIDYLAGLPTAMLKERLAGLGSDAVVFTPGFFEDGNGQISTPRETAEMVAAVSTAPVYGPLSTFIGSGVVGGYFQTYASMASAAGRIAGEILNGTAPDSVRLPLVVPPRLHLDWRQIRRWDIDEDVIPTDAVLHFHEPSLFEEYEREVIIALVVFGLQSALIVGLLLERRRRRYAEEAVQTLRFELAHASRRDIAAELTASIAHEINQPLGAILSNADAAEMILESGTANAGQLREIVADIRRQDLRASEVIRRLRALLRKHNVEHSPFELNDAVREVGALLATEARRRGVRLDIRPAPVAATMVGDRIQIQQVVINLLLNAMDALADLPEERRTILVTIDSGSAAHHITVRDRGRGIPPEHRQRLFDSFYSTKREGMGMGLAIARRIVETHGGRIGADNGPDEGAVFQVELPSAGAAVTAPPSNG